MQMRAALDEGHAFLRHGPHPDQARRDAELLLMCATGLSRAALLAHATGQLDPLIAERYAAQIERRLAGEPIQYITGETEFFGLAFQVTRDVLIPRPETEHLVEKVVELAAQFPAPRIVDVGAGSGAIAVALAHALPKALITAVDVSEAALNLARENATRNHAAVRFLHGDLLAPVADERFDFVVSNPPYVPAADRDSLAVEVRAFEPALALFAGDDGLDVYRRLIPAAFAVLAPGGFIALEIGYGQADAVGALLADAGFADIAFTPDLQGIPRVACARRS
ncbi:MAG TPA: peptide chain release factor N(5)-glutamine methyltransferase [Terracidiphilus sp.]|jgi:release factor glutamine methyltransferase|nr:peptide chain release factor N(5)-glutamine methyltransferase [Terracidiphilus sp.]